MCQGITVWLHRMRTQIRCMHFCRASCRNEYEGIYVNIYVTMFICINVSGHNTLVDDTNSMHALLSGFSPEYMYIKCM